MRNKLHDGHLGRNQLAVIDDLLNGLDERQALRKNQVSPYRYRKWLKNPLFKREFTDRKESFQRQRKFILIHSLPQAARRLAELINSEKDEVARKACLDIINFQKADHEQEKAEQVERADYESRHPQMSHEKAAKIWAIMAQPDKPEPESVGADPCVCPSNQQSDVGQTPYSSPLETEPQASATDSSLGSSQSNNAAFYEYPTLSPDVLAGAAACGIAHSLLVVAFPGGPPQDYLESLRQVAKSPGANPDREKTLKSIAESQASYERRKRLIRTY